MIMQATVEHFVLRKWSIPVACLLAVCLSSPQAGASQNPDDADGILREAPNHHIRWSASVGLPNTIEECVHRIRHATNVKERDELCFHLAFLCARKGMESIRDNGEDGNAEQAPDREMDAVSAADWYLVEGDQIERAAQEPGADADAMRRDAVTMYLQGLALIREEVGSYTPPECEPVVHLYDYDGPLTDPIGIELRQNYEQSIKDVKAYREYTRLSPRRDLLMEKTVSLLKKKPHIKEFFDLCVTTLGDAPGVDALLFELEYFRPLVLSGQSVASFRKTSADHTLSGQIETREQFLRWWSDFVLRREMRRASADPIIIATILDEWRRKVVALGEEPPGNTPPELLLSPLESAMLDTAEEARTLDELRSGPSSRKFHNFIYERLLQKRATAHGRPRGYYGNDSGNKADQNERSVSDHVQAYDALMEQLRIRAAEARSAVDRNDDMRAIVVHHRARCLLLFVLWRTLYEEADGGGQGREAAMNDALASSLADLIARGRLDSSSFASDFSSPGGASLTDVVGRYLIVARRGNPVFERLGDRRFVATLYGEYCAYVHDGETKAERSACESLRRALRQAITEHTSGK